MAKVSGTPANSFVVIAALLSTVLCAATSMGAEVTVENDDSNTAQLEGEGGNDLAGLAGCYDIAGIETDDVPYSGTFCVTVLRELFYELTWTLENEVEEATAYGGLGVSVGNDLFSVWKESGTDYDCYLHLFEIDIVDGTLHGLRVSVDGNTSSQTGTRDGTDTPWDWGEVGRLAGSYVLKGSDEYSGRRLTVTHLPIDDEDAYTFGWFGDPDLEGVGVREGLSIVVVASPVGQVDRTCGSQTLTKTEGSRVLHGTFFTPDSLKGLTARRRGEETATPRE